MKNKTKKASNVLVGSLDGQISVVDLSQGMSIQTITEHKGAPITSLDSFWLLDESKLQTTTWLASSRDRRVSVWSSRWSEPRQHKILDLLTFPAPHFTADTNSHLVDFKYWLKYPPSLAQFERRRGATLATETLIYSGYGLNKEIVIYDFVKKQIYRTISLTEWPECWAVSAAKTSVLALGTKSRLLQIKDIKSGAFQDFALHADKVTSVCFSRDGKKLFTSSFNEIFIWDVNV